MVSFPSFVDALHRRSVRFVLIGIWGVNAHASDGANVFTTNDFDLFLPPDPDNLLETWRACDELGFSLRTGPEPLGIPHDRLLAQRVVDRRGLVRATAPCGLAVDLTLVMSAFDFDQVWSERRRFIMDGVEVPVARLSHIVRSKTAAGREKDRLFLATHADTLRQMLADDENQR